MTWSPDVSTSSVFVTLVLQSAVGAVLYILFELLRSQREVYFPKRRTNPARCPSADLSTTWFAWTDTLNLSDEETLRMVGLDGMVLLRFLRLCAVVSLGCGTFALIFLLPIYSTAFGDDDVVGIDRFTIANITSGGVRLWAPMLCTYIFTLTMLYMLYREYETFVALRHRFLREGDADMPTQHLFSTVAENIPAEYQTSAKLRHLLETFYPGQVLTACIGMDTTGAAAIEEKRKLAVIKLEKAVAQYDASGREKVPMVGVKKGEVVMCGGDEQVEAIAHYIKQVHALNLQLAAVKTRLGALEGETDAESTGGTWKDVVPRSPAGAATTADAVVPLTAGIDEEPLTVTATGFVTFRSRYTQAVAVRAPVLSARFPDLTFLPAPAPGNIIWANIDATLAYIRGASLLTRMLLYTGLVFWAAILAFISAISSLSNLEKYLPFLKELDPVTYALLEGQLPVIALIVFIMMLPVIFAAVATYIERRKTHSDVQMEVFTWFFLYQIANVYLILLAGSIFGALSDAISNPASIITLLANSLPGVSTFFLNLLLTFLLSGVPLALLRIGPAATYKLYRACFNERKLTRRELLEGPLAEVTADYATLLPQFLYILCIALNYWVIAPIVGFVAGLVFAANYAVYKYQLCYVIANKNESGGMFFYKLYTYSMVGLMTSAITMVGYLGIKEAAIQAPLLVPLPIIIYCVWSYTEEKFKTLSLGLTLEETLHTSAGAESNAEAPPLSEDTVAFTRDFFTFPALRGDTDVSPDVYRVRGAGDAAIPLFSEKGWLREDYRASTKISLEDLAEALRVDISARSLSEEQAKTVTQHSPMKPAV